MDEMSYKRRGFLLERRDAEVECPRVYHVPYTQTLIHNRPKAKQNKGATSAVACRQHGPHQARVGRVHKHAGEEVARLLLLLVQCYALQAQPVSVHPSALLALLRTGTMRSHRLLQRLQFIFLLGFCRAKRVW